MAFYERFDAWRLSHELALTIYRVTERWPKHERFELTSQLRRAALSAPSNIAEGASKRGGREFRRFLDIALGSLAEVQYLLKFRLDFGLTTAEQWQELEHLRTQAARLTWGLYRSLSSSVEERPPT